MTSSLSSTVSIAQQLLDLASDPENQVYIVQEAGCMSGLVSYLVHASPEVRMIAAKAVKHLSSHPGNRDLLTKQAGLLDNLETLAADPEDDAADVAQDCLDNITPKPQENVASGSSGKGKSGKSKAPPGAVQTVVMMADGIVDPATRFMIERSLIRVRGVVSVTIDGVRGQIVACTRQEGMEEALLAALKDQGVTATVFKLPADGGRQPLGESNGQDGPMYLDDIYPLYSGRNNTVSTYGFSSLEARLEAKRREEAAAKKKEERAERFLGSISSGIGSMFSFW